MNQTIWRYELTVTAGIIQTMMPRGAKALHVAAKGDRVSLWALVDMDQQLVERTIHFYGTGFKLPDLLPGRYLGTVQLHGGKLVLHVFDDVLS